MGTRTAAYRDGRVIFIRTVMDEALAKFIADAIIVVRNPPSHSFKSPLIRILRMPVSMLCCLHDYLHKDCPSP